MSDLNNEYIAVLSELSKDHDPSTTSTTQALEAKVRQRFKENIII